MERPQHELLAVASKSKQSRVTSLASWRSAFNVGIIAALVVGLSNNQLRKEMLDISASVDRQEGADKGPAAAAARAGASAADRRGAAAANRDRRAAAAAAGASRRRGCRRRRRRRRPSSRRSRAPTPAALSGAVAAHGRAGHHRA